MITGLLKVSSLVFKRIFYRPEHNAKGVSPHAYSKMSKMTHFFFQLMAAKNESHSFGKLF